MNEKQIEEICVEIEQAAIGRRFGRIFPISRLQMALDLRLTGSRFLFVSVEPNSSRIHLIERRLKDLERAAGHLSHFHLLLKKFLSGGELRAIAKLDGERVLTLDFDVVDEMGGNSTASLAVQLTGRSSNLFLLDAEQHILAAIRETAGDGQQTGQVYKPPERPIGQVPRVREDEIQLPDGASLSERLDRYHQEKEADERRRAQANAARSKLTGEITRRRKLITKLQHDLELHGDAVKWKRFGDLILANLADARREDGQVVVTDFFDETLPAVRIDAEDNLPLTEIAEKYFRRYTRARNAAAEIAKRLEAARSEIEALESELCELDASITDGTFSSNPVGGEATPKAAQHAARRKKQRPTFTGARRFRSSDGYELLVGKRAIDNDQLTFRVAASNDMWLHAADYPGSHVIIRNPNRQDIPQRTMLEAAQLAAFYSSGKTQPKAAVHYTPRKFVNKPKGSATGLVRLASFKTILVEPGVPAAVEKIED